jgi:hypothetical protein
MAPKKRPTQSKPDQARRAAAGKNRLLTLTLVPLIVGILLIGAWALDLTVLANNESQLLSGILFCLLSFALSNALQRRWWLAAGWGLLVLSDLILLISLALWAQVAAIVVGLLALAFLIVEFSRQYRENRAGKPGK